MSGYPSVKAEPRFEVPAFLQADFAEGSSIDGPGASPDAWAGQANRARFIRLTYLHLFGAIMAFVGLEIALFEVDALGRLISQPMREFALAGRFNWLIVVAAFCGVGIVADQWARRPRAQASQYVGLLLYITTQALLFVPLLALVEARSAAALAATGVELNIVRGAAILAITSMFWTIIRVLMRRREASASPWRPPSH